MLVALKHTSQPIVVAVRIFFHFMANRTAVFAMAGSSLYPFARETAADRGRAWGRGRGRGRRTQMPLCVSHSFSVYSVCLHSHSFHTHTHTCTHCAVPRSTYSPGLCMALWMPSMSPPATVIIPLRTNRPPPARRPPSPRRYWMLLNFWFCRRRSSRHPHDWSICSSSMFFYWIRFVPTDNMCANPWGYFSLTKRWD